MQLGREKEAKDAAKLALMMPLWLRSLLGCGSRADELQDPWRASGGGVTAGGSAPFLCRLCVTGAKAGEADVKVFKQKIVEMSKSTRTIEMSQACHVPQLLPA